MNECCKREFQNVADALEYVMATAGPMTRFGAWLSGAGKFLTGLIAVLRKYDGLNPQEYAAIRKGNAP